MKIDKLIKIQNWYQEQTEYLEWQIKLWDSFEDIELDSLMKSNRFTRATRNYFNHFYRPFKTINSFIPLIFAVAIAHVAFQLLLDNIEKNLK